MLTISGRATLVDEGHGLEIDLVLQPNSEAQHAALAKLAGGSLVRELSFAASEGGTARLMMVIISSCLREPGTFEIQRNAPMVPEPEPSDSRL